MKLSVLLMLCFGFLGTANAQDMETFDLSPGSSDSGGTLQLYNPLIGNSGAWYVGVGSTLARNVLTYSDPNQMEVVDQQFGLRFHGGATVSDNLRVHVRMPYFFVGRTNDSGEDVSSYGLSDASLGATWALFKTDNDSLAGAVVTEVFVPFGGNPDIEEEGDQSLYLSTGGLSAQLSMVLGGRAGAVGWTINGGGRYAGRTEFDSNTFGNKITGGAGFHWLGGRTWLLGTEVNGQLDISESQREEDVYQVVDVETSKDSPLELHVYSTFGRGSDLGVTVMAGTGLNRQGYGSPAWRLGVVFSWRVPGLVNDRDGDGIFDFNDPCPSQIEDLDGFEDEDGCLDEDNDQDGMLDDEDECRNEAEDLDGIMDSDGCPEDDGDSDGVLDLIDECPEESGSAQAEGCPDFDEDGVMDSIDRCLGEPGLARDRGCPVEDAEDIEVSD